MNKQGKKVSTSPNGERPKRKRTNQGQSSNSKFKKQRTGKRSRGQGK